MLLRMRSHADARQVNPPGVAGTTLPPYRGTPGAATVASTQGDVDASAWPRPGPERDARYGRVRLVESTPDPTTPRSRTAHRMVRQDFGLAAGCVWVLAPSAEAGRSRRDVSAQRVRSPGPGTSPPGVRVGERARTR